MHSIIEPIDKEPLQSELKGKLFYRTKKAGNEIYIVNTYNAPSVVKEIGRLRELSFRNNGGGSGNPFDLDVYDTLEKPFEQLIVWNPSAMEIIGGYRFLHGKNAKFNENGIPELPIGHIFDISQKYIDEYLPYTIELGRAFIQPKYQSIKMGLKSLYSLDNLWDGLGAMVMSYDDVSYLVGKVTIYPQMSTKARYAIVYFLSKFFPDNENLLIPMEAETISKKYIASFDKIFTGNTIKDNFSILNKFVKKAGENIPPLIRAYIELSDSMKTFGTCIDREFGYIHDTGIMITIDDIYQDKKERYLESYLIKSSILPKRMIKF
ncbi:MAG: GNAT family N-acetyltransferase [Prevotellaceae bacterium]|jgi:hypothetical protein|nr:GNAT family N-acetyltransferase [Prevotellaceae bacterium]